MYTLIKFIQSLVRALNSEGTPGQVAAGITLGCAIGLSPLMSAHNLLLVAVIFFLKVSVPGALLGWLITIPLGFALDPMFDSVGSRLLLESVALQPLWTTVYNTPVLSLANLNNTVVLGSLIVWAVLAIPIFFATRWGVTRYRATLYERLQGTTLFKALKASRLYNTYRLFQP